MFVKFQYSDTTNCLRIFSFVETTPPTVGLSVTPPIKKPNGKFKRNQHKQVLESHGGKHMSKKNVFVKDPLGRTTKNVIFRGSIGTHGAAAARNGVLEKEDSTKDGVLENLNGSRTEKNEVFGANGVAEELCNRSSGSSEEGVKNGGYEKEKMKPNGYVRTLGGSIENCSKSSDEITPKNVVDRMHTKCSTKWARYGGNIPAMLEALETVKDLDEAMKPWEKTLTNKERSILLKEQIKWERAMEIFEWFKSKGCYEVNVIHYNIMLRILGKARRWCEVESLWGEMEWKRIKPINSTYGTLIDVYSKGGHMGKAVKWLELMNERGMEADEVTMGIVVQMYKKAGDFKTAEDFFKNWSSRNSFVEGRNGNSTSRSKPGVISGDSSSANICLSNYTYNTMIDTYGKAGKLKEASETFERMFRKGVVPNTVTFNTMIHMYGSNGQIGKVASLMKRMEGAKCSPDTRTYNILISLHAKHNDIESAARYLKKMKKNSLEPDAVSYRTLLYAFSIRRMVVEAEELISEMDEKGLEIDEFTQSSLTRMYIEAGLMEKSWAWFERFHLGGNMTSDCYSANIDAFGERGHILLAEKVFDCCLKVKKLSVLEFNVMIKAYGIGKRFDRACLLFDSMGNYGIVPDRCGYNSLVQMLASADLPERAVFYLRKMHEVGLVIDCVPYCAVISSYAKVGNMEMAVEVYNEMIACGIKPDVIVYGVLINAYAETGNVNEATYYLNTMRSLGLPMNGVVCKSLIKLYTKVGYLKEAQEVYEKLQSFEEGIDVYSSNCMIDLYSERSMVLEAELIFENLKKNGDANEFTYAMMLCMYKRNGRFVEGFWIAKKMRELGFMKDVLSYNHVLGLYASDGRYKDAVGTFEEMVKSNLVRPDNCTFKSLGIILLKCGVPKVAIDRLEMKRKEDYESGIRAWASILSSVVDMDDDDDDDVV